MDHLVVAKTILGSGPDALVLEVRAGSVRIKRRGLPDLFVPLEQAADVGRFLQEAAAAHAAARRTPAAPLRRARA